MLARAKSFSAPLLVLTVFAAVLASIAGLSYSLKITSDSLLRHNALQGTAGDIAARVQIPLANHRTHISLTVTTDPLSQLTTVSLVGANDEHDGLVDLNVGHAPTAVAAGPHYNYHSRPPLIINTPLPTVYLDDCGLQSQSLSRIHLPSFFYGILFAVLNAIWILRGFQVSILFNTKASSLRRRLSPHLLNSFDVSILCGSSGALALSAHKVSAALHAQARSLLQRSRIRFLTDAPDLESGQSRRPTYANAATQTDDVEESLSGYQSQYTSQSEYQDEGSRSRASYSQDDNAPYNPFNTSHYVRAADGIDDPYAPHLSLPFSPFIVPQSDTNACLRRQLAELRLDDKLHNAVDSINTSRSVIEVHEAPNSSPSLACAISQFDPQKQIYPDDAAVPRQARLFASFAADSDPVYSPGLADHSNISLPSTNKEARQARPRWEALSPASSPETSSEEGTSSQSEGSVTSDEELPEDLAWIFNYKDAPILWATRSFDSLYVSDLQASAHEVVAPNIEDLAEIPDLDGSINSNNGTEYVGEIPDEMLESQIAEDFQVEDDSDILQSATLQHSTFV